MLEDRLLQILRCPSTKQLLRYATDQEKETWGIPLEEESLITEDGKRIYRTINGLPVLLSTTDVGVGG
ncbi:hypothetical protein BH11VER1_BH11VER1_08780 [soil metagenome]